MAAIIPIVMAAISIAQQQDAARSASNNIQDVPGGVNTGNSSVSQSGNVFLDPSIRGLRNSLLSQYQGLGAQSAGTFGDLMTQAGRNSPGYINSVVDPLRQQVNSAFGDLVLGEQRRGIRGSSLGNNAITDFADTTGRALSDATASATNQSIGLQAGLEGQFLGSQGAILGAQNNLNQQSLQQELAALGLGENEIGLMLQRADALNRAKGGGQAGLGSGLMGLGQMLPGLSGMMGGGGAASMFGAGGGASATTSGVPSGFGFDMGSGLSSFF